MVLLCLERSIEMVVALLGVMKAGGAYIPLDPALPAERLRFIVEDTRAPVQEAISEVREALNGEDVERIRAAVDDLAAKAQTIGQAMYGQGGQPGSSGPADGDPGSTGADAEDVVDAEVVDEEDKKD